MVCNCQQRIRVSRREGETSRYRTILDWCIEITLYGGGGALLGFLLGALMLSRVRTARYGWLLIVGTTVVGFVAGLVAGERGLNWVGQKIRDHEQR